MTVLAWSPLRSGLLTGKYLPENAAADAGARLNSEMMKSFATIDDAGLRTIREVVALAREIGATPAQVALAWLRYRPVPVIPIIGARKLSQLEDNIKSLSVTLTPEQLQRLNQASAVPLGFPHDFLAAEMVRTFAFGGMRDRIKA
jgi:aryl-alcohol dehydrogenase-like predicted oxidoreductase